MNIHTPTSNPTVSGSPRGRFGRKLFIAGGTGVVLAAVAAVGVLSTRSDPHESASPAVQAPAAIQQSSAPFEGIHRANGGYTPHTIYIVGSDRQASDLRNGIDEANGIRASFGEPFLLDEVVVVFSNEDAAVAFAAQAAANEIFLAEFGDENRIVDLRG